MSRTWKVRPSEFYGIADELAAHYFDKAIGIWGLAYEADITAASSNAKTSSDARRATQIVQQRWMDDGETPGIRSSAPEVPAKPTAFRDPTAAFHKVREQRG